MAVIILGICAWVTIFSFIIVKLRELKLEISHLPTSSGKLNLNAHPISSTNIKEKIQFPDYIKNKSTILLIASPTCPPCHQTLSELSGESKKIKQSFVVLADSRDQQKFEIFRSKYKNDVQLFPLSHMDLQALHVNIFPMFIVVNSNGIVKKVTLSFKEARSKLRSIS